MQSPAVFLASILLSPTACPAAARISKGGHNILYQKVCLRVWSVFVMNACPAHEPAQWGTVPIVVMLFFVLFERREEEDEEE